MYALGVDIGGTKIAGAIVGSDGRVVRRARLPTPATQGMAAILQAVVTLGRELLGQAETLEAPVAAVGVGTAGHVDRERGRVTYASQTLKDWTGAELAQTLSAELGLPVAVENDVNAMALGEMRFGAGHGFAEALYVAVGTGVGGAVVRQGQLWRGTTWTAGELGHLVVAWDGDRVCSCGRTGHLSAYASGPAIARQYAQQAALSDTCDLHSVAARARDGDAVAQQVIHEGARILGLALSGLLNVLDPEVLIVGGGLLGLGSLWWNPLADALRANPMPGPARIAVRPAQLGQDAAIVGAAWSALQRIS